MKRGIYKRKREKFYYLLHKLKNCIVYHRRSLMASINELFRRKTNENWVHWRHDSFYQLDDCKTLAPERVNKGCESRATRWPFLFAASSSQCRVRFIFHLAFSSRRLPGWRAKRMKFHSVYLLFPVFSFDINTSANSRY